MNLSALLAAVLVTAPLQSPVPQNAGTTIRIGEQAVPLRFPSGPALSVPGEVTRWQGWAYLQAGQGARRVQQMTRVGHGDWTEVGELHRAARQAMTPETPVWRAKVLVFGSVEMLVRDGEGLVRQRRGDLGPENLPRLMEEIARFVALAEASAKGNVRIEIDFEVDRTTVRQELTPDRTAFDLPFLSWYFGPRVNGGQFDAEDRVFRGPYHSILYVHPALVQSWATVERVNGMPVSGVAYFTEPGAEADGVVATALYQRWSEHVADAAMREGFRFGDPEPPAVTLHALPAGVPETAWRSLTRLEPPSGAQYVEQARSQSHSPEVGEPVPVWRPASRSRNVEASIVDDAVRGTVLRYSEVGTARFGGMTAPALDAEALAGDVAAAPYLTFFARSSSVEPIALRLHTQRGIVGEIVLGRIDPTPVEMVGTSWPIMFAARFQPNDQWQQIAVDLRPMLNEGERVLALEIGVPERTKFAERMMIGPVEYLFDDVRFEGAVPAGAAAEERPALAANAASADQTERALAARSGQNLSQLLKDPVDLVRINALAYLIQNPDPAFASDLRVLVGELNPRIGQMALVALSRLDGAQETLRRGVSAGVNELVRGTSAMLLAESGDPKLAGVLSVLIAYPHWQARLAGAEAIAQLPGQEPMVVLMAFLQEVDPSVRFAVTSSADPRVELVRRRLMWSAVNDPSDNVRAMSNWKLVSKVHEDEAARQEGYKGVRDESRWVRLFLVRQMAHEPDEAHRGALRLAVVDRDPEVRGEALKALSLLPGPVMLEEVANTLNDVHPWVQEGLLDLVERKRLTLPREAVESLKSSVNPAIARRAAELNPAARAS
jgi:hypothetical protein